jgi:hypothetical protein
MSTLEKIFMSLLFLFLLLIMSKGCNGCGIRFQVKTNIQQSECKLLAEKNYSRQK